MNKSKKFLVFFFACVMFPTVFWAQANEKISMIFQENVCRPQWISLENDRQTLINLRELLAKDSIMVYTFKVTGKAFEVTCAGCQCLTGRNIEITIDAKYQTKLEELFFQRPWVWMKKNELVCEWTMGLNEDQVSDSLMAKGIRVQLLYSTGLSQKKDGCSSASGRAFELRINAEDIDKVREEGYKLDPNFKQY